MRGCLHLIAAFGLAAAFAIGSPLLLPSEPREGLLGDAAEFASLAEPLQVGAGTHGYARHLKMVQQHYLAIEGRHPPIYYFFCTVYYLPRESGFTAERGFDMRPTQALGRRTSRSFAAAVKMEGSGRLAQPAPGGRHFISHLGEIRAQPLGNRDNPLTPRKSAAVHRRNPLFRLATALRLLDASIYHNFGATAFETADTGGGLFPSQIDLYWGEDDPLSPLEIYRPASCQISIRWIVPVLVGGG